MYNITVGYLNSILYMYCLYGMYGTMIMPISTNRLIRPRHCALSSQGSCRFIPWLHTHRGHIIMVVSITVQGNTTIIMLF